jgi:hypothetical protein
MYNDAGGKACTSQPPATPAGEPPSIEAEAPPCTVRGVASVNLAGLPLSQQLAVRTLHPDPDCHPLPRQRAAAVLLSSGADRRGRGPHRAGVVTGGCVLAAVFGCTPSVVAGSAPTVDVDPGGEMASGGRGGGMLLCVAFAGGCSIIPPPRGFIGAVTSGLSSFLSSSRFCKFASCVP